MNTKDRFNLTLIPAITALEEELVSLRQNSDRAQLAGIDSDTAFELGYESAIADLRRVTGDDPFEVHLMIVPTPLRRSEYDNGADADSN